MMNERKRALRSAERGTHEHRAIAHTPARTHALCTGALLGLLLLPSGCGPANSEAAAPTAGDPACLEELLAAWEPIPLEWTSDHHDKALLRRREAIKELKENGDLACGLAALEKYHGSADLERGARAALLEAAAHCASEQTAPLLEQLVVDYQLETDMGMRRDAAFLLADASPERAVALLEPILLEDRPRVTYPPFEQLLEAWNRAAVSIDHPRGEVLVTLATSMRQQPSTRYGAIDLLATVDTPVTRKALEQILIQTTSDGLLRRKAAQAVRDGMPQEEACALLERIADREADIDFLTFLGDLLARHCP